MRLVVSNHRLADVGGTETYLGTLAEHLQELGHEVTVFSPAVGDWGRELERRGLAVVDEERRLPGDCDAVLPQDSITAFLLADRYPRAPQLQGVHTHVYQLQSPPQLTGLTAAAIVCSETVARRMRALAAPPPLVRLRQPIDLGRFSPRGAARPRPRRVLALGNYLTGERLRLLTEACEDLGLELVQLGSRWGPRVPDVSVEIAEADIVVGKARALLEGMACGRAAYVYDWNGADGWVTPERYQRLEADNFGGRLGSGRADPARLRGDLADYRPEMGIANRDLAVAHHSAHEHAVAVSSLLAGLVPRPQPLAGPLREMARLVSLQWQADLRGMGAQQEAQALRAREWERLSALEAERAGLVERLAVVEAARAAAAARAEELDAALAEARAALDGAMARAADAERRRREELALAAAETAEARAVTTAVLATRRHRIATAIARPLDAARALVGPKR